MSWNQYRHISMLQFNDNAIHQPIALCHRTNLNRWSLTELPGGILLLEAKDKKVPYSHSTHKS